MELINDEDEEEYRNPTNWEKKHYEQGEARHAAL